MNIPKTAKLGLACAAALSYSVIPTYLLKYRWIFRSRQRASREEKVLYLTFDDGPDTVYEYITRFSGEGTDSGSIFHGRRICSEASRDRGTDEKERISGRNTFVEPRKCDDFRTGKNRPGCERIEKDYGEDGYCSEMVQTTVGTSEPGKSVLDTEAASESGILGCDGTGLVSERDPGQYLQ